MKLNLEYYDENQDLKPISEETKEVLEKVENHKGEDLSKALDYHSKIKNVLALSEVRENLLNWYPFQQDCSILELNANYGEMTGLLCKRAKRVVAIESSKQYATIIEKRHQNQENLELIVGNFSHLPLTEKFDYVVIIGMEEKLQEAIEYAKNHLTQEGILLLAANNQFGVKSWITMKEEENIIHNQNSAISKKNLEALLQGMYYQYYYPLPNYKLPNIIYTEKYMPTESNIYRDLTYKDGNVNFKEVEAYQTIIKNHPEDFKRFANSFLLEISHHEIAKNEIQFISFSNIRKEEYRIQTIVKEKEVEKRNVNEKSQKHLQKIQKNIEILKQLGIHTLDSYEQDKIISQYATDPTLEEKLIEIYQTQGKEAFLQEIQKYRKFLKEKLEVTHEIEKNVFTKYKIPCEQKWLEELTFVKYGFWDFIFQNCFIKQESYYFYDQEWLEENMPIEYILYRAIVYSHGIKTYLSDEEIFEELNITPFISLFKELDDTLQQKIRKPLVWKLHTEEELEKNKYNKAKKQLQEKDEEIIKLQKEIQNLKNENKQKQEEMTNLQNSFSWKVTKPLRAIRRMVK